MDHDFRNDGNGNADRRFLFDGNSDDDRTNLKPTKSSTATRTNTHKRNASSGLLSRFLFSRSIDQDDDDQDDQDEASSPRDDSYRDTGHEPFPSTAQASPEHAPNEAIKAQSVKTRKRKGSLRKVALLGGRAFAGDGRDRRSSFLRSSAKALSPPSKPSTTEVEMVGSYQDAQREPVESYAHTDHSGNSIPAGEDRSSDVALSADTPAVTTARLSLLTAQTAGIPSTHGYPGVKQPSDTSGATLSSPSDPKSPNSYASTTEDDDDGLSFSRPSTSVISVGSSEATYPPPLPPANVSSYFPASSRALRPRSQNRVRPSPLQNALAPTPEIYPYAETEYWGWVILFVTWLSFTVGMGSCLDIWSWAWDVGETPYAPPELEDDPTLPIVGYYPALIVLTGVVAWVWITVAWIGMKYFRHAKIEV